MRSLLACALLVVLLCPSVLANPTLTAKRLSRAPVIDGNVTGDPAWKDAPVATDFVLLGKSEPATQATEARVLYDPRTLYVAFVCYEQQMEQVVARVREFDGPTYQDDCVELFLAPFADRTRYYHWVVNSRGVLRDELRRDIRWNSGARVAASRSEDRWSVELAIPLSALALDETVDANWGVNFCREQQPRSELSSWAPCRSGFHEPDSFGFLEGLDLDLVPLITAGLRQRAASARQQIVQLRGQAARYGDLPVGRTILGSCARHLNRLDTVQRALAGRPNPAQIKELGTVLTEVEAQTRELEARSAKLPLLRAAGPAGYVVCVESPMTKVRPDRPYIGKPTQEARVYLARNEYEATQLVVVPLRESLQKVAVSVTDLTGPDRAVLPASDIQINRVGYVHVKQSSGGATMEPGMLPDPLLDNEPVDVDRTAVQSWWITVYAGDQQRPGWYRGEIRVRPRNAPETRLRFMVRVWGFTLPKTSRLRSSYGLNMGMVYSKYDLAAGPGQPAGWISGAWTGADMRGIPNYFGSMEYELAFDREVKHGGARSCRVHVTSVTPGEYETPRFCYYTPEMTLEPNTEHEFSVWYRTAPGDEHGPSVFFHPSGGMVLPPTGGEWREGRCSFNSGDGKGVRVYLKVDQVGTVWFDDVRLAPAGARPDVNLLPNPGFELGEEGGRERIRDAYVLNALRHRASPTNLIAPVITSRPDGTISIDWTEFDRVMALYVENGLSAFNVNWCELPSGWGSVETVQDEARIARARELLRQTEAHLAEKGWLPLAYIYTIDEPGAAAFPQVKQAFELAHSAAPRLKTLLTYGYGASRPIEPGAPQYAALEGYVDIHVPHTDCYEPIYLKRRQQAGDEVWAYVCISAMRPYLNVWGIDYPGLDHRLLFWQLFAHDITGFLYWEIAYWQKDPWEDTMTYPGGNADGSLIYPGKEGPVNSIRWELCRDGTEDYDMLMMLRETSAALRKGRPGPPEPLLSYPHLTRSWTEYTNDVTMLEAHRVRVGERLEALTRRLSR